MLQYIKKSVFSFSNEKTILIATAILGVIILLPFIVISFYNVPGASDDMHHSFFYSQRSYLSGIWDWYFDGYNGRFANSLFMLFPGRPFMNVYFYKIFPIAIIVFLLASSYYFFNALNKNKVENLVFSLVLVGFFFLFSPAIVQFYWYSGATVYTIPLIFYFLLLGLFFRYFNFKRNILFYVASPILLFLLIGSHENWGIITFLSVLLFFINSVLKGEKISKSSKILLISSFVLLVAVIFSPGTFHRLAAERSIHEDSSLLSSMYYSFQYSWSAIVKYFLNLPFLFLLFGIFFYKNSKDRVSYFSEKLLTVKVIVLLLILFSGCLIVLYSFGNSFRIRGVIPNYFTAILCIMSIVCIIKNFGFAKKIMFPKSISYSCLLVGLFLGIATSTNLKNVTEDIFTGRAKKESLEVLWLYNYIKTSNDKVVYVPRPNETTKTLYWFKVPTTKKSWTHWVVSTYYGKSVLADDTQTLEDFILTNRQTH